MKTFKDTTSYIRSQPKNIQSILRKMRATIKKAAPNATEKISYGMPSFNQNGYLVYFAAFKKHISLFPASSRTRKSFGKELEKYKGGKGTIQFPLDKPLPWALIRKIVLFRAKENQKKVKAY